MLGGLLETGRALPQLGAVENEVDEIAEDLWEVGLAGAFETRPRRMPSTFFALPSLQSPRWGRQWGASSKPENFSCGQASTATRSALPERNDYNLSPNRYVATGGGEEELPLEEAVVLLREAEEERAAADKALNDVLAKLGFKG